MSHRLFGSASLVSLPRLSQILPSETRIRTSQIARSSPPFNTRPLRTDYRLLTKTPTQSRHLHTSSTMSSSDSFMATAANRRTYYALSPTSPIPDSKIEQIVTDTIKHTPSAFNSQTTRIVLVVKEEHKKLWDMIMAVYEEMLPKEKFEHAKGRMEGFRKGYGTVLFYEDLAKVSEFVGKFPNYADKFGQWSEQTNGMHQYIIWTALEAEGFGVNLQHYNPPINPKLTSEYKLPGTWDLKAQMVFGKPEGGPANPNKEFLPVEGERLKVIGA